MKKGMLVVTMFVVLSFLVSMIAVAPSVSKQVTQPRGSTTTPTSSQQGTIQTSVIKQKFGTVPLTMKRSFPVQLGPPPTTAAMQP